MYVSPFTYLTLSSSSSLTSVPRKPLQIYHMGKFGIIWKLKIPLINVENDIWYNAIAYFKNWYESGENQTWSYHGYYKLWIGNWTANQGPFLLFNLVDLVATWCLTPPLQFPDIRCSSEIRYGPTFSGIWKLYFILVDLVSAAATRRLDRISSAQCLWSFKTLGFTWVIKTMLKMR